MAIEAHPGQPIRSAGIAAAATALVALVAMSAAASAVPSVQSPAAIEGRLDGRVVRMVAAVVAAAARDSTDRVTPAAICFDALAAVPGATLAPDASPGAARCPPRPMLLGERLLDLPPPAC